MMSKCPNGFYRSGLIRVPIPLQFRLIESAKPAETTARLGRVLASGPSNSSDTEPLRKLHLRLEKGRYLTSLNSYQARGFDQKAWVLSRRGGLVVGTNIL